MRADPARESGKKRSLRALEATNFFLADVQTGVGPFLAAYLAGAGWNPGRVGVALTVGGVVTVALQTPAGAFVDHLRSKRAILVLGALVLGMGAVLLALTTAPWAVYAAQVLIGGAGPFLAPTLGAITLGLVGRKFFDRQFGRNQGFNSAGNVACALLIAGVSHAFGNRAIFITTGVLTIPTILAVLFVRAGDINYEWARGGSTKAANSPSSKAEPIHRALLGDRVLAMFLACAFLFHLANAAMLPELGEMLAKTSNAGVAPLMSACILVTQAIITCTAAFIGRLANARGRKPLLLIGFGVLPLRAVLYTLTHSTGNLIAIQVFDGIANAIFGVVSVLVIADRTEGTGRFNLLQGALATMVGLGAALSNLLGGKIVQYGSFRSSFLALGAVAVVAFALLLFGFPETLKKPSAPADPPLLEPEKQAAPA
jgi:MFS family permease